MKLQPSPWEKRDAPEMDKSGDAVGRPSWRPLFLGDPDARFSCEKLNTRKSH